MASLEPPVPAAASDAFDVDDMDAPTDSRMELAKGRGVWRRTLGFLLLAVVIFLWTATSFLASAVLADHTFSQPFFVTYLNTLFFIIPLFPALLNRARRHPDEFREWIDECKDSATRVLFRVGIAKADPGSHRSRRDSTSDSRESLLATHQRPGAKTQESLPTDQLSISATAKLSLEFCLLWYFACYLLLACLEYTTVASSTILTSTSSLFTLVFGAIFGVEKFTLRKLLSVVLSLSGIMLISSVDFSGKSSDDSHRGQFPEKTFEEMALGDTLGIVSAAIYAIYVVRMKKRLPDESTVSMPIFFGFIGLANAVLLWPGFFILHWTGKEPFLLPATSRVTWILVANAAGSMLSDIAWAYAVVLTSPILVTVGLSMTIPLSLVGQMVLNSQTSTGIYWLGAMIVVLSFVLVAQE